MRTVFRITVALAMLSSICFNPVFAVDPEAEADIPVRRVVMFSSGVGFFEHAGQVDGAATAKLMFKTGEINDILKSMIVLDSGGSNPANCDSGSSKCRP